MSNQHRDIKLSTWVSLHVKKLLVLALNTDRTWTHSDERWGDDGLLSSRWHCSRLLRKKQGHKSNTEKLRGVCQRSVSVRVKGWSRLWQIETLQRGQKDGGQQVKSSWGVWLAAALRCEGRHAGDSPHGVKMKEGDGGSDQPEVPSPQTPPHSLRKLRPAVTQTDSDIWRLWTAVGGAPASLAPPPPPLCEPD